MNPNSIYPQMERKERPMIPLDTFVSKDNLLSTQIVSDTESKHSEEYELNSGSSQSQIKMRTNTVPQKHSSPKKIHCNSCVFSKNFVFWTLIMIIWSLYFTILSISLYVYWSPIVQTRNQYISSRLEILDINVTDYRCCDIISCTCGTCSISTSCAYLVQNLRDGQCCLPDECLINVAPHSTLPTQACSSLCGTCWNISRNIVLTLHMTTKNETIHCFRDDFNCLNKATTNQTVWMYGDAYFMDRPSPDEVQVYVGILIPVLSLFVPLVLSTWVYGRMYFSD